jgi:hypothetical protein
VYYYLLSCGLRLVFFAHVKHRLFYSWSTFTCQDVSKHDFKANGVIWCNDSDRVNAWKLMVGFQKLFMIIVTLGDIVVLLRTWDICVY